MTEKGFWQLLEKAYEKGRMPMMSECHIGTGGVDVQVAEYFSAHSLLPEDKDSIPAGVIMGMGKLLFESKIKKKTGEAIMIILAHREEHNALFFLREYAKRPDKGLHIFSQMALDECEQWIGQEDIRVAI